MAFTLPPLQYPYDSVEPYIDKETMQIHHDKHHAAYVNNLNAAIEGKSDLAGKSLENLIINIDAVPESIRNAVRNNGGQHFNHSFFWETMAPQGPKEPAGALADAIKAAFGDPETMKKQFNEAGTKQFGSGWVWLSKTIHGKLEISTTANQGSPITEGKTPLIVNDLWEHAYYLKYQNRRADYLAAWWNVINWVKVADRFSK
ncbi:MAG: superoxide dismutase [bacterium]|nr:superoxide dismutase [Candidatus Sumerlaeota bacterium]